MTEEDRGMRKKRRRSRLRHGSQMQIYVGRKNGGKRQQLLIFSLSKVNTPNLRPLTELMLFLFLFT